MTGINRLPVAEGVPVLGPSPGSKGSKRNTQRSAASFLGNATTDLEARPEHGGGLLQTFEHGALCADVPSGGVFEIPWPLPGRRAAPGPSGIGPEHHDPAALRNPPGHPAGGAAQQRRSPGGRKSRPNLASQPTIDSDDRADGIPAVQMRS
jgi:hypothetical protein